MSGFHGHGKKSAWQRWDVCLQASGVFTKLSYPADIEKDDTAMLEKFVVTMYDRSSSTAAVDNARLEPFAKKQRSYQAIPPTPAALVQHIRHAAHQAACVWSHALVCQPEKKNPAEWGWKQEGDCSSTLMVCTPTSCSEFLTADEMPVQDAVSRTVQMLQVWSELYDHVQLHLLRAQTCVYMESMNNAKLFIIEMTLHVHALLTCLLFVRFYYYACNMAE